MKPGTKVSCYCNECQREWAIELIATLGKDKNKSFVVHCAFCGGTRIHTTDKQPNGKNPWREHSLKELYGFQADALKNFRDKLGSNSNSEALDKIDIIKRNLQDISNDSLKYPQLELPEMQQERLRDTLAEFENVPF